MFPSVLGGLAKQGHLALSQKVSQKVTLSISHGRLINREPPVNIGPHLVARQIVGPSIWIALSVEDKSHGLIVFTPAVAVNSGPSIQCGLSVEDNSHS